MIFVGYRHGDRIIHRVILARFRHRYSGSIRADQDDLEDSVGLNSVDEPPSYEEAFAMDKPTYELQEMTKLPFSLQLQNTVIGGHRYSTNGKM